MQNYYQNVISISGKPVQGASVLVTNASDNSTAVIYSDNGVTTTPNPLTTDQFGRFNFYAANGRYNFSISANGVVGYSFSDVIVSDVFAIPSFTDTGVLGSWVSSTNSYNQVLVQNTSNGAVASAEFVAYNNAGTSLTNYCGFGINSTGYTGTGSFNQPSYGFIATGSTDLVVGTYGANVTHFVSGLSTAADAAQVTAGNVFTAAPISVPAGGGTTARLGLSSSAALGIYFGSGVPTVSAAQGSLYIRTDGSSTTTRMYINTNGTTGWTNVVTSA